MGNTCVIPLAPSGSLQKSVPIRSLLLRIQDSYVSFCSVHSPVPILQHSVCKECPVIGGKSYLIESGNEKEKTDVPRPSLATTTLPQTNSGISTYHWEADRVENVSTSLYMYPPTTYPTYSAAMDTHISGSSATASTSSGRMSTGGLNPNPFYLKFITGSIRICQGCRQSLRNSFGSIPDPPYNLVIATADKR